MDINFIALTSEFRENFPFATVFHEYIHFLTKDLISKLPVWVGEGLAEYYSTFEMSDGDRKVLLGKAIQNHLLLLRQERMLPLSVLLTVAHDSPYYNEKGKEDIALSMAEVHLRKNDFASARRLLESIAGKGTGSPTQDRAKILLEQINQLAEQEQIFKNHQVYRQREIDLEPVKEPVEIQNPTRPRLARNASQPPPPPEPSSSVQLPGTRGQKVAGTLSHIECSPRGLTFVVKSENRTLRFFSANPGEIFLYSKEMENIGPIKINCGPYTPATVVLVTFKEGSGDCQCDGEPLSIIFADTKQ